MSSILVNEFTGDTVIDFNEFLEMMAKHTSHYGLKEAFNAFDKDNDGYINEEDFRHVMNNLGENVTDEELADMMKHADTDDDKKINYEGMYL